MKDDKTVLDGWKTDLTTMPSEGHFEVLRHFPKVFLEEVQRKMVIEPSSGRMFIPIAWRPRTD